MCRPGLVILLHERGQWNQKIYVVAQQTHNAYFDESFHR
jgi:hypothetical protein